MGFFSWNCNGCGHPMLSRYATNDINSWMNNVVVILPGQEVVSGSYDGYGRVGCFEIGFACCCYHEACWAKAGKPTEWIGSDYADDQGFFFDDPEHDMEQPLSSDDYRVLEEAVGELALCFADID